MSPKRPFGLVDLLLLFCILGVAAAARVSYLLQAADSGRSSGPIIVQDASPQLRLPAGTKVLGKTSTDELDVLAHNVAEHRWFGSLAPFAREEEKTGHVSPGYPWLLGWLVPIAGAEELGHLVRWVQCGLGVLTVGLYFLFARRAFDSRLVAVLAGVLTALHPFWIVNTAALNDGTLTAFLLALILYLGSVASHKGGTVVCLLYGLSAGGLALVRAAMLPCSFVAVLWMLWRTRRIEGGWMEAILVFLGFLIGLGLWTGRNFLAWKEPVPVVTSTWYHLWMGYNPHATGGPLTEQQMLEALAEVRRLEPALVRDELADVSQPRRYRLLAPHVVNRARSHPGNALHNRFTAFLYFYFSESLTNQSQVFGLQTPGEKPPEWVTDRAAPLMLAVLCLMLSLALLAWRWTYPWRERTGVATLALVWVPIPYILGHAAHLHGPRLPLDGIFLTFAAYVLACCWPATGRALSEGPLSEEQAE